MSHYALFALPLLIIAAMHLWQHLWRRTHPEPGLRGLTQDRIDRTNRS